MEIKIAIPASELLLELTDKKYDPSISLYMPTHRSHPDNQKDIIVFKNLVKQITESLREKYSEKEVQHCIKPFEFLSQNTELWNKTLDGLAVYSGGDYLKVIYMQMPVDPLVIVAQRFHTKPLRRYLQSIDRYHILSLNLDRVQLFEGNRFGVSEVELHSEIPKTLTEALGEDFTEKHSTVASYGGTGGQSANMHHGDGGKKDQMDKDTEKFFRIVSQAIEKHYSKPMGMPLLLATLPEHQNLFHKINKNPWLQKEGIMFSTKFMQGENMAEMAWGIMQKHFLLKLKGLKGKFEQAIGSSNASDSLQEVAKAVAEGRVETLLLEQNRIIPGIILDTNSGSVEIGERIRPEQGDLLDAIAEMASEKGAEVVVVKKDNMPTESGIAAIFRY
jgi:hypothetical protein